MTRSAWLTRERPLPPWLPLAVIVALGAVVRAMALYGASLLPSFSHHRLDALFYHQVGQTFAAGDHALGDGVLHMSPLYSYFVGVVYTVFGDGPWPLRIIQIGLGLVTIVVVHRTVRLLFGRRWAIVAALVAALYGPFVFYEQVILVAPLAACLHALTLLVLVEAMERSSIRWWWAAGALWGLSALARPSALLFAAPIGIAVFLASRGRRRMLVGRAAAVACAAVVVIAPVTLRNVVVGGEIVAVTDSGGLNFYIGNGPGAIGTFRVPRQLPEAVNASAQFTAFRTKAEQELGRPLDSGEVNDYWYERSWDHIRAHPADWIRILVEKAWLFWNRREPPNTHDYAFNREINPVLGLPLVQYGWIAPFALLGTVLLVVRRRPRELVVGGFVLVQMAAVVLFFITARYRIPAVPSLIIAAIAAAAFVVGAACSRSRKRLAAGIVALVAGAVIAWWPKLPKPFDDEYFKLGYAHHVQGQLAEAGSAYLQALDINPDNLSARKNLALLYERSDARDAAIAAWHELLARAERLRAPEYVAEARAGLGRLDAGPAAGGQ